MNDYEVTFKPWGGEQTCERVRATTAEAAALAIHDRFNGQVKIVHVVPD